MLLHRVDLRACWFSLKVAASDSPLEIGTPVVPMHDDVLAVVAKRVQESVGVESATKYRRIA